MVDRFERTVAEDEAGIRLDLFLARQPEVASRSVARGLVEQGHVTVAGAKAKPGLQLEAGQAVAFAIPDEEPWDPLSGGGQPVPDVPVLYEDPWLVAINKPAGLASHPPEAMAATKVFLNESDGTAGDGRFEACAETSATLADGDECRRMLRYFLAASQAAKPSRTP